MDNITKIFIFIEIIFGVNRLRIFDKVKFVYSVIVFIYCICLSLTFGYLVSEKKSNLYISHLIIVNVASYFINSILAFIFCKKYREFFEELKSFDNKIAFESRISSSSILNAVACCIILAIFSMFNLSGYYMAYVTEKTLYMTIKHTVFSLELFTYGHLMSLLLQRLQYIKKTVIHCLDNGSSINRSKNKQRQQYNDTTEEDMKRLVLFYHSIVKAYDILNAAIKYQFIIMLLESFLTNIVFWNLLAVDYASQKFDLWKKGSQAVIMFIATIIPFFSPCHFANQIKVEVANISDSIRSNLHKLVPNFFTLFTDKKSRNAAKLLLSLTNCRTLSFSLFRMISVDILLPFKILGYIATYLIVLMQFEKITGSS
nr:gustatory receptor 19 [Papilio xuthus]